MLSKEWAISFLSYNLYDTICMIILASSVQGALRKLLESDFITFEEGSYKVSDKFFQMYLLRLQQSECVFI